MKYGVWCVRYATSVHGPAAGWAKASGKVLVFDTEAEAEAHRDRCAASRNPNLNYTVREYKAEQG